MQQDIRTNLERVREPHRARGGAGRPAHRGRAARRVSKTVEVGRIRTALAAGLGALGENRVQEARGKIAELGRPVAWHLVGHLQTNKAREALELFDVIHSVDRIDLAREPGPPRRARGRPVDVLGADQRRPGAVEGRLAAGGGGNGVGGADGARRMRLCGLMAIPPAVERAEDARGSFRALRKLAERHGLTELSMGMSGDFEVAVEEGATIAWRGAPAIFGPRPRRNPLLPER